MNLLQPEGRRLLQERIGDCGAELVVLDTFYKFTPGADPLDNAAMGVVFGHLNNLAQESGAALLILDHVSKAATAGDGRGPASHSLLGAQVKGGSARSILNLRRVSSAEGGAWEVHVDTHFEPPDELITYRRPQHADGKAGRGCESCTATEARGVSESLLRELFEKHGEQDEMGRPEFRSQRKLREAVQKARIVPEASNSAADDWIRAVELDYCAPEDALESDWKNGRPIWTRTGARNARIYRWRMAA